jgi:hypothetical protein
MRSSCHSNLVSKITRSSILQRLYRASVDANAQRKASDQLCSKTHKAQICAERSPLSMCQKLESRSCLRPKCISRYHVCRIKVIANQPKTYAARRLISKRRDVCITYRKANSLTLTAYTDKGWLPEWLNSIGPQGFVDSDCGSDKNALPGRRAGMVESSEGQETGAHISTHQNHRCTRTFASLFVRFLSVQTSTVFPWVSVPKLQARRRS